MRVEKENDFSSFSKILHKIDAGSLGEHELRMIKQDHSYLEKLRQQRIKVPFPSLRLKTSKGNMTNQRPEPKSSPNRTNNSQVLPPLTQR